MSSTLIQLDVANCTSGQQRTAYLLANHCASLFLASGSHVVVQFHPVDVALKGDCMKTGLFLAAVQLRDLLCKIPDGRQALSDLGFEPVLEGVEGE